MSAPGSACSTASGTGGAPSGSSSRRWGSDGRRARAGAAARCATARLCSASRCRVDSTIRDAHPGPRLMSNTWTLAGTFAARAREYAERPLLVANGRSWTYRQVDAKSSALAAALAELGIEAGDRIGIVMPNWPEWVVALLAAAK